MEKECQHSIFLFSFMTAEPYLMVFLHAQLPSWVYLLKGYQVALLRGISGLLWRIDTSFFLFFSSLLAHLFSSSENEDVFLSFLVASVM